MSHASESESKASNGAKEVALLLLSLVCLLGALAAYWTYPFPSGNKPDVLGFVALIFREALLLALFGALGLILLVVAVLGVLRNLFRKAQSAWKGPGES